MDQNRLIAIFSLKSARFEKIKGDFRKINGTNWKMNGRLLVATYTQA